jgi:malate dehydrogenase (oxaloacetate-decarboxylating)
MARNAIVFACANPVPEISPWEALDVGAKVVATGRSDFANQLNNSLVFPVMFRGVLDVRASTISSSMAIAAAHEIARAAEQGGIRPDKILPHVEEYEIVARVAAVVAMQAQQEGLARVSKTREQVYTGAFHTIGETRRALDVLMREQVMRTAR